MSYFTRFVPFWLFVCLVTFGFMVVFNSNALRDANRHSLVTSAPKSHRPTICPSSAIYRYAEDSATHIPICIGNSSLSLLVFFLVPIIPAWFPPNRHLSTHIGRMWPLPATFRTSEFITRSEMLPFATTPPIPALTPVIPFRIRVIPAPHFLFLVSGYALAYSLIPHLCDGLGALRDVQRLFRGGFRLINKVGSFLNPV